MNTLLVAEVKVEKVKFEYVRCLRGCRIIVHSGQLESRKTKRTTTSISMKAYSFKVLATVLACAGFAMVTAQAETKSSLNSADEKFVKAASQHGVGEVQIASLGVKKSAREDVKNIAEKMVTDHTAVNAELTAFAKTSNVEVSAVVDPADTEIMKELENKATGDDFDKAFLNQLESSHKEAIALFEDASEDSQNAQLKEWAAKTLPSLRAHLEMVQAALKK